MRRPIALLLVLAACAFGCDTRQTVEVRASCLDSCRGTLSDADVEAHVAISGELQAAISALLAGSSAYGAATSSLTGFVQSVAEGHAGLPSGFSYAGNGVLVATPSADVRVEVRFYLAAGTSFGKAGDAISFNVLDPASYFEGIKITATGSIGPSGVSAGLALAFDKAGPGTELLGLGAAPKSPVSIDVSGWQSKLSAIVVGAIITVDRYDGPTTIHFQATPPKTPAQALGSASYPVTFDGFVGTRSDLSQSLSIDSVALSSSGGLLDGTFLVRSASAKFSFQMLFSYPKSALPDIAFGCLGVTLARP
jgi:hypothetical protein